jgi:hypothetical protein
VQEKKYCRPLSIADFFHEQYVIPPRISYLGLNNEK